MVEFIPLEERVFFLLRGWKKGRKRGFIRFKQTDSYEEELWFSSEGCGENPHRRKRKGKEVVMTNPVKRKKKAKKVAKLGVRCGVGNSAGLCWGSFLFPFINQKGERKKKLMFYHEDGSGKRTRE